MRDQEIIGLWEAYQQVHTQPQEEVEQLDEGRNTSLSALAREKQQRQNPKGKYDRDKSLMMGHNKPSAYKYKKDPETGSWSNEGRRDGATESELRKKVSQRSLRNRRGNVDAVPKKNGRPMFESAEDLFDYLLEYLVAEGYADTNKAALAIMANMSEEWKQSIVEQSAIAARAAKVVGDQRQGYYGDSDAINKLSTDLSKSMGRLKKGQGPVVTPGLPGV